MSVTTSTSATMSLPPMSKASLMETRTHMEETHTRAHQGLPVMEPLSPPTHIHVGCPTGTARPHRPHIGGDCLGDLPIHTTAPLMPEGLVRACTNLIVRRMRTTGASDPMEPGIQGKGQERRSQQQPPVLCPEHVDFQST